MAADRKEIKRVLIANRGEIARRIIRTCHAMGIETVSVYSEVDAHAPHVLEASHSEPIGAPAAYVSIDSIMEAVKRSGADSVHPGYGFLSENPDFAEALEKAGITFIGPSSGTIRALGSKTNAKEIAKRANVPVAPTLLLSGADTSTHVQALEEFAGRVGYPVMIKAAAGGGGRGMRLVSTPGDCRTELESAGREALKAFGSAEIFVEKYIAPARHIEVQIVGDQHGNVLALGTRDCSLQRSNQKIIEEAPATGLKAGVTEELCEAARRLAKEVGYANLGTVEFLYTADGLFYFLEVNTRLQVEHPVTEMVTGLDLVRVQLEVARGGRLSEILTEILGSDRTPTPQGHAIEARVCAEEYTGRFVSATGVVLELDIPRESLFGGTLRADMGYEVCSEVSHYYDSLLGKLIVHANDRAHAIATLEDVLARTRISGVGTNRSLLLHLARTEAFRELSHTIQGTAQLLPSARALHNHWERAHVIAAALRLSEVYSCWAASSPWMTKETNSSYELYYPFSSVMHGETITSRTSYRDGVALVKIQHPREQEYHVSVSEAQYTSSTSRSAIVAVDGGPSMRVHMYKDGATLWIHTSEGSVGLLATFSAPPKGDTHQDSDVARITSPIPGKVAALYVAQGDQVSAGSVVLVLDSMKMEHPFRAPRAGKVLSLEVTTGSIVQAGATLAVIG